jgi:hypothetical protein
MEIENENKKRYDVLGARCSAMMNVVFSCELVAFVNISSAFVNICSVFVNNCLASMNICPRYVNFCSASMSISSSS